MDIAAAERDKLRAVFPQCFTEGRLDERKLLALLGTFDALDENDREKYEFRWKGKQEALQLAGKRSAGTLRPCPEESVDWNNTRNLYIEGDNLEVLKLLQTSYYRKIKMIYIDPPYNTGNDFVYADDFADPLARYREVTGQATKSNPESMGRFHTNWLNMMLPRLRLAANLLRDDGVIFISIDDGEVTNLRRLCDEVFGEENFRSCISWQKRYTRSNNTVEFTTVVEYVLVYSKASDFMVNLLARTEEADNRYTNPDNDPRGSWKGASFLNPATPSQRPNLCYPITNPNTMTVTTPTTNAWRRSRDVFERLQDDNRLYWGLDGKQNIPSVKMFLSEARGLTPINFWSHEYAGNTDQGTLELSELLGGKFFENPKPTTLIKRILEHGSLDDSIILDFFSGSGTTAHAVMQLNAEDGGNRRFICVQLPEVCDEKSEAAKAGYANICEIGKERIRRAGAKIVGDGLARPADSAQLTLDAGEASPVPTDTGFRVFKLDSSNLKQWDSSPISGEDAAERFTQRMLGMLDILKPGRADADVVYEVMLKLGQDLCEPICSIDIGSGRQVYGVGADVALIVCLAPDITEAEAKIIAEYAPEQIVFADQCFRNSTDKSNVKLTLRDRGIAIRVL
jgi:adenine-specific DNA-methyltransferase